MLIVYLSLTGNIRKFVERLDMKSLEISQSNLQQEILEDFILITPSYNDQLTQDISTFIDHKNNKSHLVGIVGSGNRNFDNMYCFNAKALSKKYNKPLVFTFEFSGTDKDIIDFKKEVDAIEITKATR
ncbi:ribonucleotide reductase assembly flavoprotein [Bacillus phage vB_BanS-Thrax5]|nr:ribonucleotide reductase assembly flavoprotein [Bacillus phage vB_BanS-Thrax5]